jgi:hypothetical protein
MLRSPVVKDIVVRQIPEPVKREDFPRPGTGQQPSKR